MSAIVAMGSIMGVVGHSALLGIGMAASAGLWVLGQTAPTGLPDVVTSLGPPVAGVGAMGYFLNWFLKTYIPEQQKQHADQLEQTRKQLEEIAINHKDTQLRLVTEFRDEVREQREQHEKTLNRFLLIYQRQADQHPADATNPANRGQA